MDEGLFRKKAVMKNKPFFKKLVFSLGIGLLGGMLGAWAGADGTSKAWRRYGLTFLYLIYGYIRLWNPWALLIGLVFIPLSCGYGIPDPITYKDPDEGSTIGKFWYNIFQLYPENKRHLFSDILTRGSIALMILACVSIGPILTSKWGNFFLYGCTIIGTWSFISWRGLGVFKFLDKDLGWSEMITWSITTFSVIKIIG